MKQNGGLIAGLLVALTFFGVSNLPKSSESPGATESKKSTPPSDKAASGSKSKPYSPCVEIADRLRRFVKATDATPIESWRLPASCYKNGQVPDKVKDVNALPPVRFAVATVPNPVSTHLPLFFDRIVETIQQAAQDDGYSYDASWFPWEETNKDYPLLADQQAAEALQNIQQDQPGMMVFRRSITKGHPDKPYDNGLVVFLVGEQPTGGISDEQFENALAWIAQLGGFSGQPLRILGPTFSGSLPSLQRDLERSRRDLYKLNGQLKFDVSSGTVSAGFDALQFKNWIKGMGSFQTAMENDSLMVDRFCQYLQDQGYDPNRVAVLSEDETAFGARDRVANKESDKETCRGAISLLYPRDIATLRSAYQRQSIFSAAKPQSNTNAPSTTLRGDLSEPSNSDHDTVRSYGGQLTPLAQESVLLDITNRLKENQTQFIVLRSTSSLDQIFLGEFLRRSYPGGRMVIDGADLLFTRGAEGRSLRGVMLLSTYPLLTSVLKPRTLVHRTFGQDDSEGAYIAARGLFRGPDTDTNPPIHDSPPAWAMAAKDDPAERQRPATWITVIGHGQFWPLAVLSKTPKDSKATSILPLSSDQGNDATFDDGNSKPLHLPITMWMFLFAFFLWSALHAYFCWSGSLMGSPRARAYFAPIPLSQHPTLIALGSLLIAMLVVFVAATSGLFWWFAPTSADPFHEPWTEKLLAISLLSILAVALLACIGNYSLRSVRASTLPISGTNIRSWKLAAGGAAILCLAAFALVHIVLISNLKPWNAIPAYFRSVNLSSGVSPLLPQLLLIVGAYLWFWCNLRGLAHFGDDRSLLPKEHELLKDGDTLMMWMFSQEKAATPIEKAARPLTPIYLGWLIAVFGIAIGVCAVALQDHSVRTLGERAFGKLIFCWVCLCIAVILADGIQMWRAWSELRQLLIYLDRLPLRRTLRALKGLAFGSIWKMSGNVLEERHRWHSLQIESLRHLTNATDKWKPGDVSETENKIELLEKLSHCRTKAGDFARWFVTFSRGKPVSELKHLRDFQEELASTAGMVLNNILAPEWRKETNSLIFNRLERNQDLETEVAIPTEELAPHVRAAEEFFVLPYLAFIQNILGRVRTIALGSLWLFVGATFAVASYPFDPLNVLGGIFLTVFVLFGGVAVLVYSQMARDATLSHITNTTPGELGSGFWQRLAIFGVGPLIGLLTTLFPSITDFVFSWLQPSTQALK
jgi:hypothetical protein